jgi:hypothetical protein
LWFDNFPLVGRSNVVALLVILTTPFRLEWYGATYETSQDTDDDDDDAFTGGGGVVHGLFRISILILLQDLMWLDSQPATSLNIPTSSASNALGIEVNKCH